MKYSFKTGVYLFIVSIAAFIAGCEKGPNFSAYIYPVPTVTGLSPTTNYPNTDVTITGNNFGDVKGPVKIFFGGVQADTIRSVSNTQIVVKVPAKAVTGKVSLQVWTSKLDSIGKFTVIPAPVIKSVSVGAASPGDVIKISGTGFGTTVSALQVSFNGTLGTISSVSADTLITVTVPTGFTSGPLTVFVNNYPVTGPSVAYLVPVPTATVKLSFDGDLTVTGANPRGVSATYIQGAGSALSYVNGVKGQAVWMNGYANATWGINQAISLVPATAAQYNELTLSCWVQYPGGATNAANGEWIFSQAYTRGNTLNMQVAAGYPVSNGNLITGAAVFESKTSGSTFDPIGVYNAGFPNTPGYNAYSFKTASSVPTTGWHHLCMTISKSSSAVKFYLDGALISNTTYFSGFGGSAQTFSLPTMFDLTAYTPNRCYIGSEAYGSNNEPSFNGGIDEFQIYDSALSASQVYTLFYTKQ